MRHEGELRLPWRTLAENHGFTEGPVAEGESVWFTSINRGTLYRVSLAGAAETAVEVGGGPNGATLDGAGAVWIAQNGGHVVPTRSAIARPPSIQRVRGAEARTMSKGEFFAPNDCAFGPDGRLWFTDPAGSTEVADPQPGRLWAMDPGSGEAELILDGLAHPNGLAFGADPDELYLGETRAKRIVRLRRGPTGWRLAGTYAEMPLGEPDGMAFDRSGALWIAATRADALVVLAPGAKAYRTIPMGPSFPTNVCFAGADASTLVVTAPKGGRVLAAPAGSAGQPLHAPRTG